MILVSDAGKSCLSAFREYRTRPLDSSTMMEAYFGLAFGVDDYDLGFATAFANQGQVAWQALCGIDRLLLAAVLKDCATCSSDFHNTAWVIFAVVEHEQHIAGFQHTTITGFAGVAPEDLVGFRDDRRLRAGDEVRMANVLRGSLLCSGVGAADA